MDRITFFGSISGIKYPEMLVCFFDQFIALKQLTQDYGAITVTNSDESSIEFFIEFDDVNHKNNAMINVQTGIINIYGRPISVQALPVSETAIKFILK